MAVFDINSVVRLQGAFKNASDAAADPTTITLKYEDPSANETTLTFAATELTKASTGVYYFDLTVDESGTWYYRFESTGVPKTSAEDMFDVRVSKF
jgi:hypothetical protein